MTTSGIDRDLDAGFDAMAPRWKRLASHEVLITGANGFVGTLLLQSVRHAHARLGTGPHIVALVRDPRRLLERAPWSGSVPWLRVMTGDVRQASTFATASEHVDLVIHAANTVSAESLDADPVGAARLVQDGTRTVHEHAVRCGAQRFLQLSSGSVSGAHVTPSPPIHEDDPGLPTEDSPGAVLARAKREAERMLLTAARAGGPAVLLARGFAMCGPWLPLAERFAFGNFLRDALAGGPVVVTGDGSPRRSFLYASDVVVWLWTILLDGVPSRAYNVGSDEVVSIGELADRIAHVAGVPVRRTQAEVPGAPAHWHVPDITRARIELGCEVTVPLDAAITRTLAWWRDRTTPEGR